MAGIIAGWQSSGETVLRHVVLPRREVGATFRSELTRRARRWAQRCALTQFRPLRPARWLLLLSALSALLGVSRSERNAGQPETHACAATRIGTGAFAQRRRARREREPGRRQRLSHRHARISGLASGSRVHVLVARHVCARARLRRVPRIRRLPFCLLTVTSTPLPALRFHPDDCDTATIPWLQLPATIRLPVTTTAQHCSELSGIQKD